MGTDLSRLAFTFLFSSRLVMAEGPHADTETANSRPRSSGEFNICIPEFPYYAGRIPLEKLPLKNIASRVLPSTAQIAIDDFFPNSSTPLSPSEQKKALQESQSQKGFLEYMLRQSSICLAGQTGLKINTTPKLNDDDSDPLCGCRMVLNPSKGIPKTGYLAAGCDTGFSDNEQNGVKTCHLFYSKKCEKPTKVLIPGAATRFSCEGWARSRYPKLPFVITQTPAAYQLVQDLIATTAKIQTEIKTPEMEECAAIAIDDAAVQGVAGLHPGNSKGLKDLMTNETGRSELPSLLVCQNEAMAKQFQKGLESQVGKELPSEAKSVCMMMARDIGFRVCKAPTPELLKLFEEKRK